MQTKSTLPFFQNTVPEDDRVFAPGLPRGFTGFFGSVCCRFSNSSGACCMKNARGAGMCGFNNLKLPLLLCKRPMTICQIEPYNSV